MHRNIAIFFVILLFLGCLGASQEPPPGGYYNSTSQLSHTEKASLVGSVIDASGTGPIAGVMVAIAGGGRAFNTTSDEVGEFSLENIPAGRYAALTVFAKGYEMKVLHDVELEANHTKRLEFRLEPEGN